MENTEGPMELSLSTRGVPRLEIQRSLALCPSYLHVAVARWSVGAKLLTPELGIPEPPVFNKPLCQEVLP